MLLLLYFLFGHLFYVLHSFSFHRITFCPSCTTDVQQISEVVLLGPAQASFADKLLFILGPCGLGLMTLVRSAGVSVETG